MALDGHLKDILTSKEPFGPPHSEAITGDSSVFLSLYMSDNRPHERATADKPSFVIGRRGSGKTSFLVGTSLVEGATVIRIRSEDVYSDVDDLIRSHAADRSTLVADASCHIWEVILSHVAMLALIRQGLKEEMPELVDDMQRVWSYLNTYAKGQDVRDELKLDDFLASVIAAVRGAVLNRDSDGSFATRCRSVTRDGESYLLAVKSMDRILNDPRPGTTVAVVVDNLEDLSTKIYTLSEPISALFRFVARTKESDRQIQISFQCQFCFPSEILSVLHRLVANSEKDLRDRLTIEWSAKELLHVMGNRLALYLVTNGLVGSAGSRWQTLTLGALPLGQTDATALLRAYLPDLVQNGLGGEEDPIAYILRHTQLVPRQLLMVLNEIFRGWLFDGPVTAERVISGVSAAEDELSESIISAYEPEFPNIVKAVGIMKNKVPSVCKFRMLNQIYNRAKGNTSGLDFDQYSEALFTIGALGILRETQERYVVADFDYTIRGALRPAGIDDHVCVHPLFLRYFNDIAAIAKMRTNLQRPVYPFGSDPSQPDYRTR